MPAKAEPRYPVPVRLLQSEKDLIAQAGKKWGEGVSQYMRRVALDEADAELKGATTSVAPPALAPAPVVAPLPVANLGFTPGHAAKMAAAKPFSAGFSSIAYAMDADTGMPPDFRELEVLPNKISPTLKKALAGTPQAQADELLRLGYEWDAAQHVLDAPDPKMDASDLEILREQVYERRPKYDALRNTLGLPESFTDDLVRYLKAWRKAVEQESREEFQREAAFEDKTLPADEVDELKSNVGSFEQKVLDAIEVTGYDTGMSGRYKVENKGIDNSGNVTVIVTPNKEAPPQMSDAFQVQLWAISFERPTTKLAPGEPIRLKISPDSYAKGIFHAIHLASGLAYMRKTDAMCGKAGGCSGAAELLMRSVVAAVPELAGLTTETGRTKILSDDSRTPHGVTLSFYLFDPSGKYVHPKRLEALKKFLVPRYGSWVDTTKVQQPTHGIRVNLNTDAAKLNEIAEKAIAQASAPATPDWRPAERIAEDDYAI